MIRRNERPTGDFQARWRRPLCNLNMPSLPLSTDNGTAERRMQRNVSGSQACVSAIEPLQDTLQTEAPLAELFGYANAIRSSSRGSADCSTQPALFEPVPNIRG